MLNNDNIRLVSISANNEKLLALALTYLRQIGSTFESVLFADFGDSDTWNAFCNESIKVADGTGFAIKKIGTVFAD